MWATLWDTQYERKINMLDTVNAKDDDAISELAALEKDLAQERDELEQRRRDQERALEDLKQEQQEVQARLAAAQAARDTLAAVVRELPPARLWWSTGSTRRARRPEPGWRCSAVSRSSGPTPRGSTPSWPGP